MRPGTISVEDREPPFFGRVRRLALGLAERRLDAAIVLSDANVMHLSGFHHFKTTKFLGWGTALIVTDEWNAILCVPTLTLRYAEQRATASAVTRYTSTPAGLVAILQQLLPGLTAAGRGLRLGIEAAFLPASYYLSLTSAFPGVDLVDVTSLLAEMRVVKAPVELAVLRQAARIADEGMQAAFTALDGGKTELDVGAAASDAMLRAGAEVVCHCSVKSGVNSALIQSFSSRRRIEFPDVVNVDLGAVVNGYCSDLTRTFAVGAPSSLQRELFLLSIRALETAAEAVKPGVSGHEVDAAARGLIAKAGFDGDAFPHFTGHGIGVEVHEPPFLASGSPDVLQPDTVLCLEPGVYDVRAGGMRTEDMFLLTSNGAERMTQFPRDLTWR